MRPQPPTEALRSSGCLQPLAAQEPTTSTQPHDSCLAWLHKWSLRLGTEFPRLFGNKMSHPEGTECAGVGGETYS
jgi:hypothetical protein